MRVPTLPWPDARILLGVLQPDGLAALQTHSLVVDHDDGSGSGRRHSTNITLVIVTGASNPSTLKHDLDFLTALFQYGCKTVLAALRFRCHEPMSPEFIPLLTWN